MQALRCAATHKVVRPILQADTLIEGAPRFVVPAKWLIDWSYWTTGKALPGPIDNTPLLSPDLPLLLKRQLLGAATPTLIDQSM